MILLTVEPAQLAALFSGTVLPLIVGLVSQRMSSGRWKAIALLALSMFTNVATELTDRLALGGTFDMGPILMGSVTTFLIGVGMHYGLWKPTGITEKALAVGSPDPVGRHRAPDTEGDL